MMYSIMKKGRSRLMSHQYDHYMGEALPWLQNYFPYLQKYDVRNKVFWARGQLRSQKNYILEYDIGDGKKEKAFTTTKNMFKWVREQNPQTFDQALKDMFDYKALDKYQ